MRSSTVVDKTPGDGGRPSVANHSELRRRAQGFVAMVRRNALALGLAALLLWLLVGPLAFLINMSLHGGSPARPTDFTWDNYGQVYGSSQTYSVLGNTVVYALSVTVISLVLASLIAWFVERTDMPGRNFAWMAMLVPMAIPGMLSAMSWILLASPNNGAVNVWIRDFLGLFGVHLEDGPLDIFTLEGMIWVEGLKGTSTLFLMLVGAFRLMDPSLEDAATMSGASRWKTIRRVTLPLMFPALLAAGIYGFLGNMEDFDTPLMLGLDAGVFILPTLIYFQAYISPVADWGLASAYTSVFLVLMLVLLAFYYIVVVRRSRQFATVSGKGFRPRRIALGKWRWGAFGVVSAYFFFAIALPLGMLLFASLIPAYLGPRWSSFKDMSLDSYRQVFSDSVSGDAAVNTLQIAIGAGTFTMVIAFMVSWVVIRTQSRGRLLMDAMAFAPNAIPSVALAFGVILFYLNGAIHWIGIYGTVFVVIIALSTKYLAFSTRLGNSAMMQVSAELEEAAWSAGASKLKAFVRVTMPLLLPTFVAGWIWVASHALRNLTFPLLLGGAGSETIALRMYIYWERYNDFPLTAAMGVCLVTVLLLMAFFSRKIILRGFSEG